MNYKDKNKTIEKPSVDKNVSHWYANRNPINFPPLAANDSTRVSELVRERMFYRDGLFKNFTLKEENLIDFWNFNNSYGRVNGKGYAITCNEEYLKTISSASEDGDDIYALNFVVDAFEDMVAYLNNQAAKGNVKTSDETILWPLEAKKAWESPYDFYNEYIAGVFDVFANDFMERLEFLEDRKKIKDFQTFVSFGLVPFLSSLQGTMPFTFSSFVKCAYVGLRQSGLTIEVSDGQPDDDFDKYIYFLSDENFEIFRKAAKIHGFWVDKNVPWRLVANINHPYMMNKQMTYGFFGNGKTNADDLLSEAFIVAQRQDISMLQINFSGFYNAFQQANPSLTFSETVKDCKNKLKTKTLSQSLEQLRAHLPSGKLNPESDFFKKFGDLYWLKIYLFLRNSEQGKHLDTKSLETEWRRYYNYYKMKGFIQTVDEINRRVLRQTGPVRSLL